MVYRVPRILCIIFLAGILTVSVTEAHAASCAAGQPLCRHVLTLKDFWDDPDLTADPRNLVSITFRQAPDWVMLPKAQGDTPAATIPYYLDRTAELEFSWDDPAILNLDRAVLKDATGTVLWTLESGGSAIRAELAPGMYSLEIYRRNRNDRSAVYIQPWPDVADPLYDPDSGAYPGKLLFRSRDCPGCNLSGGNLFQADMARGSFADGNLSGANLFQADLSNADLTGTNLEGGNIFQVNLADADLTGAGLAGANVFQSNFTGATLSGADLTGINAPEACFVYARLDRAVILGAVLGYINAAGADFTAAQLKGTIFKYADLTNACFAGADLSETDFTGAKVDDADFSDADMTDAVWISGRRCTGQSVDTCK